MTDDHMARACSALMSLTAAEEDLAEGRGHQDLVDDASDELAEIVADGPEGLVSLLRLLSTAIGYGAAVSGQSGSFVARTIANVTQAVDAAEETSS